MSALQLLGHMLAERLSPRSPLARVPEADAVMDDPRQALSFARSGQPQGVLAPLYLLHAIYASACLPAQGTVLELGCGAGSQLLALAALHPQLRFIGLDLSAPMLALAHARSQALGFDHVTLRRGDMTNLSAWPGASVDAVICTLTLHHLPDTDALTRMSDEIARVLKPSGGLYCADFGRLKREATLRYLVSDRQAEQDEAFTRDFMHSLRAAFTVQELRALAARLSTAQPDSAAIDVRATWLAPFMVTLRRTAAALPTAAGERWAARVRTSYAALAAPQQRDLHAMAAWWALAGLRLPIALPRP